MIQDDAVKIGAENAQNHRFLIVDKRCRERHAHSRQRHGSAKVDAQVLVQNLRHDVQAAGGGVPVEQNAQADADHQNVAEHVQLLTAGHGFKVRKQELKQPQKQRQQDAGIDGLCAEFFSAGQKADD